MKRFISMCIIVGLCMFITVSYTNSQNSAGYVKDGDLSNEKETVLAVQDKEFKGTNLEKGLYAFYPNVEFKDDKNPGTWEVYVSKTKAATAENSELVGQVGGPSNMELTADLKKGDYVLILHKSGTGKFIFEKE